MYPRILRKHFWFSILTLILLLVTTSLAAAQSPDVYMPLVTGEGETEQQAPDTPVDEEVGEEEIIEQPDPAVEEAPVSIAAYNSSNWYVSGRMGVGTDLPAHKLSVIGGPSWTSNLWLGSIELTNSSAIAWRANSAGYSFGIGHRDTGLRIFRTLSNPGTTASGPLNDLSISNSGLVGIGTTTPAHKLSIVGGPAWTTSGWGGAVDLTNGSAIAWRTNDVGWRMGMGHSYGGFYIFRTFSDPGNADYQAVYDLNIDDSGNVGIGTVPAAKLHVLGTTRLSGDTSIFGNLYVNGTPMNVPDYVFEPDYPLMSLDELRAYIAAEKHLPNVPNAEQIGQDGLNMTDFQMTLLEKTEELTLYTLAQDEQIKSLQQEIESLQQENQAKDAQLETLQQVVELLQQQDADLETRLTALEEQK